MLVLPNLAAMSDAQCAAVRRFVEAGGGLVATGETSLYDEEGRRRADFALADLLGRARHRRAPRLLRRPGPSPWASGEGHSLPAPGRVARAAPPVLEGFEEHGHPALRRAGRDRAGGAGGGGPAHVRAGLAAVAPRERLDARAANGASRRSSSAPSPAAAGRLPARGLDRCFGRDRIPDHGRLIANLVRWASRRPMPLEVEGPGLLDVHLYRQSGPARPPRRQPDEPGGLPAVRHGPVPGRAPPRARGQPSDLAPARARRLVAGGEAPCAARGRLGRGSTSTRSSTTRWSSTGSSHRQPIDASRVGC